MSIHYKAAPAREKLQMDFVVLTGKVSIEPTAARKGSARATHKW